jgi:hypothetical protein
VIVMASLMIYLRVSSHEDAERRQAKVPEVVEDGQRIYVTAQGGA